MSGTELNGIFTEEEVSWQTHKIVKRIKTSDKRVGAKNKQGFVTEQTARLLNRLADECKGDYFSNSVKKICPIPTGVRITVCSTFMQNLQTTDLLYLQKQQVLSLIGVPSIASGTRGTRLTSESFPKLPGFFLWATTKIVLNIHI